jgi:uncharacterized protein
VELNNASPQLLSYVSGLGPQLAKNIVAFRHQHGPFARREDILKVPRLGPKAYEQCASFLRIQNGTNPLDASAVHPERYGLVSKMARDLGCGVKDLMSSDDIRGRLDLKRYIDGDVGMPTLTDIIEELKRPGRDPRRTFESFRYQEGIHQITDLRTGMVVPGKVTNVTRFGAFVDIGVHQDGLVHISHLSDQYVGDPSRVVKVGQTVRVTVMEVDTERKRISLSMKSEARHDEKGKAQSPGPDGSENIQQKLARLKGKFRS